MNPELIPEKEQKAEPVARQYRIGGLYEWSEWYKAGSPSPYDMSDKEVRYAYATPPSTAEVASVDDVARKLLAAFQKAEPDHAISKNPASFMATFADMARAVVGFSPSTVEVEARALEWLAEEIETAYEVDELVTPVEICTRILQSAQRIREQSND